MERLEKPKLLKNEPIFRPGYWAAITVKARVTPMDCYVGEIQAVDVHGVRITLVDWMINAASGFDIYVAWEQIAAAYVATEHHSLEMFLEAAGNWQTQTHERTGYTEWKEKQKKPLNTLTTGQNVNLSFEPL